jgi:hypothetical protein
VFELQDQGNFHFKSQGVEIGAGGAPLEVEIPSKAQDNWMTSRDVKNATKTGIVTA